MATNTTITKRRVRDDDEPPYARYAFWNPYNVSLFLGGITLGVAIDHTWLAIVTCAALDFFGDGGSKKGLRLVG